MTDYAAMAAELREVVRLHAIAAETKSAYGAALVAGEPGTICPDTDLEGAIAEHEQFWKTVNNLALACRAARVAAAEASIAFFNTTHAPALLALAEGADRGWRLVPTEPTEEMLAVADKLNPPFGPPERIEQPGYSEAWRARIRKSWGEIYKAMLGALPAEPKS